METKKSLGRTDGASNPRMRAALVFAYWRFNEGDRAVGLVSRIAAALAGTLISALMPITDIRQNWKELLVFCYLIPVKDNVKDMPVDNVSFRALWKEGSGQSRRSRCGFPLSLRAS